MKFAEFDLDKNGNVSNVVLVENLKKLRKEIVLNSLYISDYNNSFEIDPHLVCSFFDGFVDFMSELEKEKYGKEIEISDFFKEFDTIDNLVEWYYCHDEFGDE